MPRDRSLGDWTNALTRWMNDAAFPGDEDRLSDLWGYLTDELEIDLAGIYGVDGVDDGTDTEI